MTRLSGTSTPITTNYAYTATFNQVKTVTDPLGHETQLLHFSPDTNGNVQYFKDAVGNTLTFTYNPAGQVLTAADQATPPDTTTLGYSSAGDLTSVKDLLNGNTTPACTTGQGVSRVSPNRCATPPFMCRTASAR